MVIEGNWMVSRSFRWGGGRVLCLRLVPGCMVVVVVETDGGHKVCLDCHLST